MTSFSFSEIKILAIGDLHFKADNSEQTYRLCTEICKIIKTEESEGGAKDLDGVVVLGDILHRHDKIDLFSYHRAVRFLMTIRDELDRLEIKDGKTRKLFILIGNHDRPNNTTFLTDEHAFTSAKLWKDTIVVDKPIEYTFTSDDEKHKFLFVPYVQSGRFFEAISSLSFEKTKAVFAHQEFRGCKLGPIISTEGDVYPLDAPLCISGHIHEYSKPQPNIVYVGTPFKSCWSIFSSSSKKTSKPIINEGSVSFFTFSSSDKIEEKRIKIKGIPFNVALSFDSSSCFFDCVQKARFASETTTDLSLPVKRPLTYNILKQYGMDDSTLQDVNLVKIKIKCNSREDFMYTVFNSQERVELAHECVSILSEIAPSTTSSLSKDHEDQGMCEISEVEQTTTTFHQDLIHSFKKEDENRPEIVKFFIDTFPEFKSKFS
jgi:DNA repair exonuclease SbcCD nuclease subunit